MDQWYIAKNGQQEGPVTPQQIVALVKSGTLDPATTHVWREGLSDWKTLGESGLLAETGAVSPAAANRAFTNPYVVTERTRNSLDERRHNAPVEYPGYGRLRYILTTMILTIICYAILAVVVFAMFSSKTGGGGMALVTVAIVLSVVAGSIYIALQRLKNLGMSGWAMLWSLVPFMNLWIGWRMLACPAGYEQHRTLDTPAKVITGIWIGLVVLSVAMNIIVAVAQR